MSNGSRIEWLRGGTSPETLWATFELSTDGGSTWTLLGAGTRIADGWELTGLSLPATGKIRARARTPSGSDNGSSGLVETILPLNAPQIEIEQPSGEIIANGGIKDFGTAAIGGLESRTFVIRNSGTSPLNVTAIRVSGPDAVDFAVTGIGLPATVSAGMSQLVVVTFTPGAIGQRYADMSVISNDPSTANYLVRFQGTGVSAGELDPTFDVNQDGWVYTMAAQPDGKLLIGGDFTMVAGAQRNAIVRLKGNGTLDTSFTADVQGAYTRVSSIAVQPDGKIVIGGNFATIGGVARNGMARLYSDGTLDPAFEPNPDGSVVGMAPQPDGKLIIVGYFYNVGGVGQRGVARLNTDGTLDSSFAPVLNLEAYSVAVQADGKILIGGLFTSVNGETRNRIARLNSDGTVDQSFIPNVGFAVNSLAEQPDGRIVIAGNFSTVNGLIRNNLARLNGDGSLDSGFDPNVNGPIETLAIHADGKIHFGGSFTKVGTVSRNRIARVNADGTLDADFNPNADGVVYAMTLLGDGGIMVGGNFTTFFTPLGGVTRNRIARLENEAAVENLTVTGAARVQLLRTGASPESQHVLFDVSTDGGVSWTSLGSGVRIAGGWELTGASLPLNGLIRAVASISGGQYNGSSGLVGTVAPFSRTAKIVVDQPDGSNIANGSNKHFGTVSVGGSASLVFIIKNTGMADLTGLNMTIEGADAAQFAVTVTPATPLPPLGNTTLTIQFEPSNTGVKTAVLRITSNDPDENPFDIMLTGAGTAVALPEIILVGGGVSIVSGDNVPSLAYGTDFGVAAINSGTVTRTFTIQNTGVADLNVGAVLISGAQAADFTVSGIALPAVVGIGENKTFSVTFDPAASGIRFGTVVVINDDADEGRYTFAIQGTGFAPGAIQPDFDPKPDGPVNAMALQTDGKIVIGGGFTSVAGVARNRLARLNPAGSLDETFNPDVRGDGFASVRAVAMQPDGKIVIAGDFTSVAAVACNRLARLNSDGSLDESFNPGVTGDGYAYVSTVAMQPDGKIIIGGDFTTVAGVARNRIARLNADGTLDLNFDPNIGGYPFGWLNCLVLQTDGKIVVGGLFASVDGEPQPTVARLNSDGSRDVSFTPNLSGGGFEQVESVIMQPNGKIIVGGLFTTVDGVIRNHIARLNNDGTLDMGFNPNADGQVVTMSEQADGKIVIGGFFLSVGGITRNFITRLNADGTMDPDFNPEADGPVFSVAVQPDGAIVLGGGFFTIGGLDRNWIARLEPDATSGNLGVLGSSRIEWSRGGASPETSHVTFELSTDGGSFWSPLGSGARIAGGWELTGLSLPISGQIRARAITSDGGHSSGFVETAITFSFTPHITVEQPVGSILITSATRDFGIHALGSTGSLAFIIKNTGSTDLTGLTITKDGANATEFAVTANPTSPLNPNSGTTFVVQFTPTSAGIRTAALHIASNDPDQGLFEINLSGQALSANNDTDGDGLNDLAELQLSGLGFNWKVNQANLVTTFFSKANTAGLFTQSQMDASRQQGRDEILNGPNAFGLYSLSQIQALNVDTPLLGKDSVTGQFKLTIGVEKSTDLIQFDPFPMSALQTVINAQGNLEFQFSAPDNAAFFLLRSQ